MPSACWKASKIHGLLLGGCRCRCRRHEGDSSAARCQGGVTSQQTLWSDEMSKFNLAAVGELEGVGEQVLEDLLKPLRVGLRQPASWRSDVDAGASCLRFTAGHGAAAGGAHQ